MRYSVDKDNVCWRMLEGEVVILNVETTFYYTLNKTGSFIWNLILEKELGAEEITKRICARYRKKENAVVKDIKNLLADLAKEKLIKVKEQTDAR